MNLNIKKADLTGVSPGVLISMNGNRLNSTKLGGFCSIFASLLMLTVGVATLKPLFNTVPP